MKNTILILLVINLFISCTNEKEKYETYNYVQRLDSISKEINQTQTDLDNLKKDILDIIVDTPSVTNWEEDIDVLIGQPIYLNGRLTDLSTMLIMQADSIPFFVADTLNSKFIKNYNEKENTSVLLSHGMNKIVTSYLLWFDKIFSNARSNKNSKRPQYVNKIKLLDFWDKEGSKIKTLGDFEIVKHNIHHQSMLVVKELLIEYKAIWNEIKGKKVSFYDYFQKLNMERPKKRPGEYTGWVQLYKI